MAGLVVLMVPFAGLGSAPAKAGSGEVAPEPQPEPQPEPGSPPQATQPQTARQLELSEEPMVSVSATELARLQEMEKRMNEE